ncbi:hypothetical protein JR316_0008601 [Psilocybe cubensis]|uniref:Uncharacterized protein n=2 Tax=Psilocybe cubensis TaxID=181762 RepID=A0ACB8GR95_PSICU|nr:hypothetical protein JR316_0008601 [Psilocybe cubensis]KAH9478148.1 hypothetical protein JR316_0008601 [Psilocybe cubensis]
MPYFFNLSDSESMGVTARNTAPDAVDGTSYLLDNGTNLMLDQHTAPVENADGNKLSSFLSPHIEGCADAAQHQGLFSDNARPWFELGEDSNTHHPSTSLSTEREEKKRCTSESINDGREELRSRLTNELVERQDVNEAQRNDGGYGGRREIGPSQTIGRYGVKARLESKRRRDELDSEGYRRYKKPRTTESPDSACGLGQQRIGSPEVSKRKGLWDAKIQRQLSDGVSVEPIVYDSL